MKNFRLTLVILSLSAMPAAGQDISEKAKSVSGIELVRAFLGHCAQNAGNTQRTVEAAEALDYAELPEKYKPLMAPKDPTAEFQGWLVSEGEGAPYLLGVSNGQLDGKMVAICAVANPYIATPEVVSALSSAANLTRPDYDETQMGQRFRVWQTETWADGSLVTLTDGEPMGIGGATLAIMAPVSE